MVSWRSVGLMLSLVGSAVVLYFTLTAYLSTLGWYNYEFVNPQNDREMNLFEAGLFHAKQSSFKILKKSGGLKLKNETIVRNYQCQANSPSFCDDSEILVARLYFQIAVGLAVAEMVCNVLLLYISPSRSFLTAEIYFCQLAMGVAYLILVVTSLAGVAIFVSQSSGFAEFDPTKLEYGDQFFSLFMCQAIGGVLLASKVLVGVVQLLMSCCASKKPKDE
jgi:hypothetical protein